MQDKHQQDQSKRDQQTFIDRSMGMRELETLST